MESSDNLEYSATFSPDNNFLLIVSQKIFCSDFFFKFLLSKVNIKGPDLISFLILLFTPLKI